MTLFETAAELSATAADLAASIADERACPAHVARARDLLDTLAAEIGDTDPDRPVPYALTPKALTALAEDDTQPALFTADPYTRNPR